MFTGTLTADLLLGDVHSLKGKRSIVRPIVAELRRRYSVAAAEVGDLDLHRRVQVGVATVAVGTGLVPGPHESGVSREASRASRRSRRRRRA